jgi:hypothetical protein
MMELEVPEAGVPPAKIQLDPRHKVFRDPPVYGFVIPVADQSSPLELRIIVLEPHAYQ